MAEVAEGALQVLLVVGDAGEGDEEVGVVGPLGGGRLEGLARQGQLAELRDELAAFRADLDGLVSAR